MGRGAPESVTYRIWNGVLLRRSAILTGCCSMIAIKASFVNDGQWTAKLTLCDMLSFSHTDRPWYPVDREAPGRMARITS